ncbi:MAG: hypothetical protein OER90_00450 [Gemmatimonadota bacterium]|nr:hypothetical protein [Gemmatimonadota bacterium]
MTIPRRARIAKRWRSQLTVWTGVIALGACGAVNTRPYLTPLPGALIDTLQTDPMVVIEQVAAQVTAEGVTIRIMAAAEGFLETRWHELALSADEDASVRDSHSTVRFRFFADPIGERQTQLTSEAVTLGLLDPSLPERERERLVPSDHPGSHLARRIVAAVAAGLGPRRP